VLLFTNTATNLEDSMEGTQQKSPAKTPQEGGAPLPYEMRSLGYPRSRKNGGHSEAGLQCLA